MHSGQRRLCLQVVTIAWLGTGGHSLHGIPSRVHHAAPSLHMESGRSANPEVASVWLHCGAIIGVTAW